MLYTYQFETCMSRLGRDVNRVPEDLYAAIDLCRLLLSNLMRQDDTTQKALLPILVNTDAYICAELVKLLPQLADTVQVQPSGKVDKVRLMELKAKALKLKWDK